MRTPAFLLALSCFLPVTICAQVGLSGEVGFTYTQDFGRLEGESSTRVNNAFKGSSPFSLTRARFFIDGEVADNITVFTTLLFDESQQKLDVEGAYVVIGEVADRPWLNALVGKMPTAFGTFAARSFAMKNPLIGIPLIYQYFSAVQGASVPRDNADQLAQRGDDIFPGRGLPTLYDACWNTGAQLFGLAGKLSYALALTKGAVSNPAATDNDGVQVVGRLGVQPTMGLKLGLSFALAPYLNKAVERSAAFPAGRSAEDYLQRLVGFDFEYAAGHFTIFAEAVRNEWQVPNLTVDALGNTGGYIEGKYELGPGLYYALRYGFMEYDALDDGAGGRQDWDYGVRRLETGLGYYLSHQVRLKAQLQLNSWAQPVADRRDRLFALQLASSF